LYITCAGTNITCSVVDIATPTDKGIDQNLLRQSLTAAPYFIWIYFVNDDSVNETACGNYG
jgi:hypothetical protein